MSVLTLTYIARFTEIASAIQLWILMYRPYPSDIFPFTLDLGVHDPISWPTTLK